VRRGVRNALLALPCWARSSPAPDPRRRPRRRSPSRHAGRTCRRLGDRRAVALRRERGHPRRRRRPEHLDGVAGTGTRTEFGRYRSARRFARDVDSWVFVPYAPAIDAPRGFTIEAGCAWTASRSTSCRSSPRAGHLSRTDNVGLRGQRAQTWRRPTYLCRRGGSAPGGPRARAAPRVRLPALLAGGVMGFSPRPTCRSAGGCTSRPAWTAKWCGSSWTAGSMRSTRRRADPAERGTLLLGSAFEPAAPDGVRRRPAHGPERQTSPFTTLWSARWTRSGSRAGRAHSSRACRSTDRRSRLAIEQWPVATAHGGRTAVLAFVRRRRPARRLTPPRVRGRRAGDRTRHRGPWSRVRSPARQHCRYIAS